MKFRDEVEIAFDDSGAGEAVLLLHGHPFNRSMWQAQTAALRSNFRVVAPDLRGYGETPVHGDISSLNEMANDLIRLLDYLKLETVVLGGLSMGGYVASSFTTNFPNASAHSF